MNEDVRIAQPGERSKDFRRQVFWPVLIVLIGILVVLCAMVMPRWLGYEREVANSQVYVRIYDMPETKTQVIVGNGSKRLSADLPSTIKRDPDGSAEVPLKMVIDPASGTPLAGKHATIENAEVQRILGDDVITVGTSPTNEIFVVIPPRAKPSQTKDWGPQIEAKARMNLIGDLKPTPPPAQAQQLFRIKSMALEPAPLPPLYMEATQAKVVATKPMFGEEG